MTMMLTVILKAMQADVRNDTYKVIAYNIHKDDIDFTVNSVVSINKNRHYHLDYKVEYITNRVYKFVNTVTGELTNNEAILYKQEIPVITRNDYIIKKSEE